MKNLPFNACDYRCERCLVTSECAVFRKIQERSLLHGDDSDDPAVILKDIRESFRETEEMIKKKALEFGIDIDEIAGQTTEAELEEQTERTTQDPLYKRAEEFTREAHRFLEAADAGIVHEAKEYFDDIAWHHTIVPVKVFRALGWRTDPGDVVALDGRNSAAVAMNSLTICTMAFNHLASRYPSLGPECGRLSETGRKIKEDIKKRFMQQGTS